MIGRMHNAMKYKEVMIFVPCVPKTFRCDIPSHQQINWPYNSTICQRSYHSVGFIIRTLRHRWVVREIIKWSLDACVQWQCNRTSNKWCVKTLLAAAAGVSPCITLSHTSHTSTATSLIMVWEHHCLLLWHTVWAYMLFNFLSCILKVWI